MQNSTQIVAVYQRVPKYNKNTIYFKHCTWSLKKKQMFYDKKITNMSLSIYKIMQNEKTEGIIWFDK